MVKARDQQRHLLAFVHRAHPPVHLEVLGDRGEFFAYSGNVGHGCRRIELDPHEEEAGLGGVELLGVENVEPGLEERLRNGGDDARPIGAGEGEDVAGGDSTRQT